MDAVDAADAIDGEPIEQMHAQHVALAESDLEPMLVGMRPSLRPLTPLDAPHCPGSHAPALETGIAAVTLTHYDAGNPTQETFEVGDALTRLANTVDFVFDAIWRIADSDVRPQLRAADDEEPTKR